MTENEMKLSELFLEAISSEKDGEINGMFKNAYHLWLRKEAVGAYWILNAFSLERDQKDTNVVRILNKIRPIKQLLYHEV